MRNVYATSSSLEEEKQHTKMSYTKSDTAPSRKKLVILAGRSSPGSQVFLSHLLPFEALSTRETRSWVCGLLHTRHFYSPKIFWAENSTHRTSVQLNSLGRYPQLGHLSFSLCISILGKFLEVAHVSRGWCGQLQFGLVKAPLMKVAVEGLIFCHQGKRKRSQSWSVSGWHPLTLWSALPNRQREGPCSLSELLFWAESQDKKIVKSVNGHKKANREGVSSMRAMIHAPSKYQNTITSTTPTICVQGLTEAQRKISFPTGQEIRGLGERSHTQKIFWICLSAPGEQAFPWALASTG